MKKYGLGIVGFFILVILDQYTKYIAIHHLKDTTGVEIIPGIFRLEYLENRGAAFGIFQGQQILLLLITVGILLLLAGLYYKTPVQRKYIPMQITILCIAAGAVGNMIDRIGRQFVVDFFYFYVINFPVFNVADCYVVIGVALAVLLILFYYKEEDFAFLNRAKK
ncbi:MAG: signal peptidase II [Eubacteriales bacterium]|nr:signal peptidase II [Eubacteriales bacterium]